MTIYETIRKDFVQSRINKDGWSAFYAVLIGEMDNEASRSGGGDRTVTDEIATKVLKKTLKGLHETLKAQHYSNAQTSAEIAIVEKYLPQQITEDQLRTIVHGAITSGVACDMKSLMAYLKEHYAGRYDGKMASAIVKEVVA